MSDVVVLAVSADLPFAMKRFCTSENINSVIPLSMMRSRNFAKDYGVLLVDGPLSGITARAVIVIDKNNKVIHSELVNEIANEPNYDDALNCIS
jgi:thiol peroxidase